LIAKYVKVPVAEMPKSIPSAQFESVELKPFTNIWQQLPTAVNSVQPKPMEAYSQYAGFILYKTTLIGHKTGKLTITDLHDYATIFVDGKYIGKIDRALGEKTIDLPKSTNKNPVLEIFVEAMGRINFASLLIDRKGITERVSLNGMTLMNWEVYNLPMDEKFIDQGLRQLPTIKEDNRSGKFFKGNFILNVLGDTYVDMKNFKKGIIWVNGHNLGRYWYIGPQFKLFCPANFLKAGSNEMIVFDLHQLEAATVAGFNNSN